VKVGDGRKFFLQVRVAADDPASITENTHDAAMLPVGFAVVKRELELAQHVLHNISFDKHAVVCELSSVKGAAFGIRHKAWPGAFFKLIKIRDFMLTFEIFELFVCIIFELFI
jgi:hypothetical protein